MWKLCSPLLKFLATPLPALVVGEGNLGIGFGPPHFKNASAIADRRINMQLTKFHVVPRKGTLAYLCDVTTLTLGVSVGGRAAEKVSVTYHFVIWSI